MLGLAGSHLLAAPLGPHGDPAHLTKGLAHDQGTGWMYCIHQTTRQSYSHAHKPNNNVGVHAMLVHTLDALPEGEHPADLETDTSGRFSSNTV